MKQEDVLLLGNALQDGHEPGWSGVYYEDRDPRYDARVSLPFKLVVNGLVVEGYWFSATTVCVQESGTLGDGNRSRLSALFEEPHELEAIMLIALPGFSININLRVRKLVGEPGASTVMLRITKLHENARESMRRVIRYYQSGRLPTPDEILAAESEETPISDAPAPESVAPRRRRQVLALVVSGAVLAGVIAAASVSIYNRVFVIRSEFATITAPKLDVLAAATGRLIVDAPAAGQSVVRDQLLYTIQSPELDSELALLDAQIEAIKGMPAKDAVKDPGTSGFKLVDADNSSEGVSAGGKDAQLQLLSGQRKALELRREELSDFSACDCTVAWAAENGSWIKQGDPVVVLARTSNEAMRIEALVKLKNIDGLTPGATAYFRDPKSRKLEEAVVERVSLDPERQPRYGFPDWLRQDPTLGSVTLALNSPVSPDWVGLPIEVMFVRPIEPVREAGSKIASMIGPQGKLD